MRLTTMLGLAVVVVGVGCGTSDAVIESDTLVGADDFGTVEGGLSTAVPIGSVLATTANLNMRTGPGTSYSVRLVVPNGGRLVTINRTTPDGAWYNVTYNSTAGWVHGGYVNLVEQAAASLPVGTVLSVTTSLNMRSGPSTSYGVIRVLAQGQQVIVARASPEGAWYNITHNGTAGWVHSGYVTQVQTPVDPQPTSARAAAIERAKSGVGFSYFWGHGSWVPNGATSSTKGVCTGDCPSCTHSGRYGADCSGFAAKVWQVPSSNTTITTDSHPYGTVHFNGSNSQWTTVSRSSLKPADAVVYNINGSGHIAIYESGDGWGNMWAYEARGCAYGIVHNLRTFSSDFKGIARAGY